MPVTVDPRLRDNMVPKAFQAGYANTTGFRKVVKATIYIKKKDGMSDADFIEYYNNNHAQRAVPILQRHGILSYSLVQPERSPLHRTQAETATDIPFRARSKSHARHYARQSQTHGL